MTAGSSGNAALAVLKVKGLPLTLLSVFCAFLGWSLLLPVIPVAMLDDGYGDALAGLSTGIFMAATVGTQFFVPRLLRSVGYVPVMIGAAVLLGVPSAFYLIDGGAWFVLLVSAVRGIGFGAVTVAQSALLAELVPPRQLGRANAFFGAAIGVGEILGFSIGLTLYTHAGDSVFLIAVVCGVVGALGALGVPPLRAAPKQPAEQAEPAATHAPLWKLALVPVVGLCTGAMGFGALSAFAAPAVGGVDPAVAATVAGLALAVTGAAQIVGRIISGWWADRIGEPGRLVVWASLCAVGGMLAMATVIHTAPSGGALVAGALGSAALFGLGFGGVQSETLLMMFARMPRERLSEASATWNMSFDSGTGAGSAVLGVVASSSGYGGVFLAGAGLVGLGTVTLAGDRWLGRHRVVGYRNIRTRLRHLTTGRRPRA
ncbi:MFS transporter [uncultured Corynebacterium sp.]|uniref:MFS transporter n=1 Tax=uncultured Corynebacterium sp. TaxID=159447 RepID=UPI0025DCF3D8|nr:MFS transporter [uncultured Corynebacterium sp.]